jgi:proteasome lid subunit RPN8/RPN11
MYLWLTASQADAIVEHAMSESPHEACGLIGGINVRAEEIIPIKNVAQNPESHYEMERAAFVKAMFDFQKSGLSLTGIYHSHPASDPIPSTTDIYQSYYPDTIYLIVSLKHKQPTLAAWCIYNGQVERINLHIGDYPPTIEPEVTLTRAQKVAVLLSALIAFMLMLTLSLSLLPPAPPLPVR